MYLDEFKLFFFIFFGIQITSPIPSTIMFEPTIKGNAKRKVQCNLHHPPTTSFLCGGKLVLLISLVFIDHWVV
jgi:hypothetical protein